MAQKKKNYSTCFLQGQTPCHARDPEAPSLRSLKRMALNRSTRAFEARPGRGNRKTHPKLHSDYLVRRTDGNNENPDHSLEWTRRQNCLRLEGVFTGRCRRGSFSVKCNDNGAQNCKSDLGHSLQDHRQKLWLHQKRACMWLKQFDSTRYNP